MGGILSKPSPYGDISRLAVDQESVTVGSLYNARKDQLIKSSPLNIPLEPVVVEKLEQRLSINFGKVKENNQLNIIDIDKELLLSAYLRFVTPIGILALIDYLLAVDQHTRFFSYYYLTKQSQSSVDDTFSFTQESIEAMANNDQTHVVTGIEYGIHVIIILQPISDRASGVDNLLKRIKRQLTKDTFDIGADDKQLLDQFTTIRVFSNISDISGFTKLDELCHKINALKADTSQYPPTKYRLRSIEYLCSRYSVKNQKFVPLNQEHMNQMESYLHCLLLLRKQAQISFSSEMKQCFEKYLKQPYEEAQQKYSATDKSCNEREQRARDLILRIRNGEAEQDSLSEPLFNKEDRNLLEEVISVTELLQTLEKKGHLIKDLNKNEIEYLNVKELVMEDGKDLEAVLQQIQNTNKQKLIYCFDDKLAEPNSSKWNTCYKKLIDEHRSNSERRFVYADFSFCVCQLSEMEILTLKDIRESSNSSWDEEPTDAKSTSSHTTHPNELNLLIKTFVNVLLLGESGVGKSTFINAIVNYLSFDTVENACSSRSLVVMPVSFLITVGDHFKEQIIKFGGEDSNENFHHPGQSVTQHCRSYVFTIGSRTKLRLIDTPGMGDTRGIAQDDLNMQHILSYISHLSHLNAICILLKPNESKLNIVFRSYFSQLLNFLGKDVQHHIIFCFTHTRTTFYAPGDTGPLLISMLKSYSFDQVSFKKSNTFCFDNESFRYLIACQNGINFDEHQKNEYKKSWENSVRESNRLLQYICNEMEPYSQKNWNSIEHARLQINRIVRPLLETIKNSMRNKILLEKASSKPLIELKPNLVSSNSTVCIECPPSPRSCGEFWIMPDQLHIFAKQCNQCRHDFSQHSKVSYALEFKLMDENLKFSRHDIEASLEQMKQIMQKFVDFHKHVARISQESDPILCALKQMIRDESSICRGKDKQVLNQSLCVELRNLKKEYEEAWNSSKSDEACVTLVEIYKIIEDTSKIRGIDEQLSTIKQMDKNYMKEHEKRVS